MVARLDGELLTSFPEHDEMKSHRFRYLCLVQTVLTGMTLQLSIPQIACAAPMIELVTNSGRHQGKNIAHNQTVCWLASPDGVYESVSLSDVISFNKLKEEFQPSTTKQVAAKHRSQFDRNYDVQTKGKYVICAPKGKAESYGEILSEVDRSFAGYFSRRNWSLENTEYPLVVVIHPSRQKFDDACRESDLPVSELLQGFYHPHSNRVTLYDIPETPNSLSASSQLSAPKTGSKPTSNTTVSDEARRTTIHEAIHQLAFNTGLHSRLRQNPRWVVEGLATTLEEGGLQSRVKSGTASRINATRLEQFQKYRESGRSHTIKTLITDDETLYRTNPVNFYSEAWAFSFYLSEQRRPEYINYLKRIAQRNSFTTNDSPEQRLADFQAAFGNDLDWIETRFLRFIDDLPQ